MPVVIEGQDIDQLVTNLIKANTNVWRVHVAAPNYNIAHTTEVRFFVKTGNLNDPIVMISEQGNFPAGGSVASVNARQNFQGSGDDGLEIQLHFPSAPNPGSALYLNIFQPMLGPQPATNPVRSA